jgi:hypothetical protein
MNCAVVVQTCDKYEPFWEGFFYYINKQWDSNIKVPFYFCNEEKELILPDNFFQIKTGKGTFVQNLKNALDTIKEDYVFYMLEDFWPIAPMSEKLFYSLFDKFKQNDWDALQVSSYTPYYNLNVQDDSLFGQKFFKFKKNSDWIFNFQARFWKKEILRKCLVEPAISEKEVNSAITVEIESDKFARENLNLNAFLFHYFWYPISGTVYRGELSEIGIQMQNTVNIEKFIDQNFLINNTKTSFF